MLADHPQLLAEEIHFWKIRKREEHAHRHQKADEAKSADCDEVGIVRRVADMIDSHLAPDLHYSDLKASE